MHTVNVVCEHYKDSNSFIPNSGIARLSLSEEPRVHVTPPTEVESLVNEYNYTDNTRALLASLNYPKNQIQIIIMR